MTVHPAYLDSSFNSTARSLQFNGTYAIQHDRSTMDPPAAPSGDAGVGSPLVPLIALAAALVKAILYLLNVVRLLVAFLTITIPT